MVLDEIIDNKGRAEGVAAAKLELPIAPVSEQGPVKVWEEPVTMLTYTPAPPDKNPTFPGETRVPGQQRPCVSAARHRFY